MTGVASRLFEEMHEDPPQIDRRPIPVTPVQLFETRCRADDRIDLFPHRAIGIDSRADRVFGPHGVVGHCDVLSSEPVRDPEHLRTRQVLDQPDERGPAFDERPVCNGLIDTLNLPHQRVSQILQQRTERLALVGVEARRLLIGHEVIVRPAA